MMRVDDLKYNTKKEGFFAKKEITEYVLGHFSFTSEHPISINSATGQVYFGQNKVLPSQIVPTNLDIGKPEVREYVSIMDTVDKVLSDMNLEIMINADNVEQILEARKWGATSIGLVRSENILRENETNLFSYGRLLHSLLTINKLWQDEEVVKKTGFPFNKKIEAVMKSFDSSQKEFGKVQEDAFYNILKTQNGKRTQIRLLDPSLSELFSESDVGNIIDSTGVFYEPAKKVFYDALKDKSVRGVRLLVWPEIYEAQLNSLFNAYERVKKEGGAEPDLRIFIPYVDNYKQVERVKEMAEHIISQHHYGSAIKYEIGVTLETPGGCASAPEMIKRLHIKNFALGTNDLFPLIDGTGSRNEGSGTIASYVERAEDSTLLLSDGIIKLLSSTLDSMEAAAKEANLEYSLGICGEMNEVKLHNKNLGQYISRAQYVSAGRPQQIPILKFIIAQNYLKERMS
jgi:phosphoenolpyruvate synthase/pyruvate phosphate dikinase